MRFQPSPSVDEIPAALRDIEAVVFDFDGTLAELILDFDEMKRIVARAATPFLRAKPIASATPVLEWLGELAGEAETIAAGSGPALTSRAMAAIEAMEVESAARGVLFPFTRRLLSRLSNLGVHCGIITRNCSKAVRTVFPDVDSHVRVMLARDDVERPKPHPDHLREALGLLGANPRATLMVGDHPMDMATAAAAGTRSGGVASGRLSAAQLRESGADIVATDCAALFRPLLGTL
ncbi:MAG: HAD family hydrolase [Oceanidesulfovibrio sp.]